MTDLHTLSRRVSEADGPSRELDGAVLDAMLKDLSVSVEHMARDQKMRLDWLPHYTSSIEAVVALIAGKLPDWSGYHDTGPNLAQYKAAVGSPGRPSTSPRCTIWATGKTPALALLSAALLAIHERDKSDDNR